MILFFDTETTGLPLFNEPSDDERQPHLLQFAAIVTENGQVIKTINTLVKPGDGATLHPKAFEAHGISLEQAANEGVDPEGLTNEFVDMAGNARLIVGHNVGFDVRIMRIMAARHLGWKWEPTSGTYCTMRGATNIVKAPPTPAMIAAGRRHYKSPSLSETYRFLFGEDFVGAHDALADVTACRQIFDHLTQIGDAR